MTTSIANNGFQGKVIIIGGGIGGSALGLFLHKVGIPCVIYEAYAYKEGVGGGLGLAPNGLNVLAALGLAEKVKSRGSVARDSYFYSEAGRVLARYKTTLKYGQPAISIMRTALYEILAEEINRQGVQIHYCKRLVGITQTQTKVIAHFEDGTQDEGDMLVGADGARSQTRRIILPNGPHPEYIGILGVGGVVPAADLPMMTAEEKERFNFTFGAKGFFGYCGAEKGEVMWWGNLASKREYTREEIIHARTDDVREELRAIYGNFHAPIPAILDKMQAPVKVNIYDLRSLPTWHQGRVLLMGDAAHAVSPNSGQGASMAMEDAMYLAKLLRDTADYQRVFGLFEQERKPRVERIVEEGRRRGNDKEIVSPLQQKIRELMIVIFVNLFGEKGQEWMYEYKIDWNEAEPARRRS
jgi:2-polyprenyl-6-methoxyphenol hydroxylase-like FAD-dependent oxidoreductase